MLLSFTDQMCLFSFVLFLLLEKLRNVLWLLCLAWNKKSSSIFDVTICSFDGAETCELVGSMILFQLNQPSSQNIGLYIDDRLAVFNKTLKKI